MVFEKFFRFFSEKAIFCFFLGFTPPETLLLVAPRRYNARYSPAALRASRLLRYTLPWQLFCALCSDMRGRLDNPLRKNGGILVLFGYFILILPLKNGKIELTELF